jgi:hypothetical protein
MVPWARTQVFLLFVFSPAFAVGASLNLDVTQSNIHQTICIPGYTKQVRPAASFTNGIKDLMLKRAGLGPAASANYTLDHIIPLAIGGHPRKLDNFQLQTWAEAKRKDRIEVKLQCLVCAGQVPLRIVQHEIAEDWEAAYHRYARVKCIRSVNKGPRSH